MIGSLAVLIVSISKTVACHLLSLSCEEKGKHKYSLLIFSYKPCFYFYYKIESFNSPSLELQRITLVWLRSLIDICALKIVSRSNEREKHLTWHSFLMILVLVLDRLDEVWSSSSLSVRILIDCELPQALEFLQW